jgi:hypothetical protein
MKENLRYYVLLWLVAMSTTAMAAYPYIENKGQLTDQYHQARSDVRFYTDYKGNDIFIADHGMHYRWLDRKDSLRSSYRVDIDLLGAAAHPQALTGSASPDFRNYYNASAEGVLGVRSYDGITLSDIYPHIDWHFYTADSAMEYDFIVRPGGTVDAIRMQVSGAVDLNLQADGSLKITTPFGSSVQQAPVARQGGREVPVRFALHGTELSFLIGAYDTTQTMVIDPIIQVWGTYYDGYEPSDIKTDKYGNVYAVGTTYGTSGLSTGPYQITYGGGSSDGYIVKFDKNGQRLWSTYYGGTGDDNIYGCSVDTFGNLFISGTTTSPNGIALGGFKNTINSLPDTVYGSDAFLVKFNQNGIRQWGTYLGSIGEVQDYSGQFANRELDDFGYECATDLAGNVFLVGAHRPHLNPCYNSNGSAQIPCTDVFIGTPGSYHPQPVHSGISVADDAFIAKFSNSGSRLWGTYIGVSDDYGSWGFKGLYCATDRKGNIYIAGTTDSSYSGNSLGIGGFQNTANWHNECWLSKLNASGTNVLWSTYYGNYGDEYATDICTDAQDNVFLAGTTTSTSPGAYSTFVTSGLFYPAYNSGAQTPFLAKFDSSGVRRWGTYYSEANQSFSGNLAADDSGRVLYTIYSNNLNTTYPITKQCNNFWHPQSLSVSLFTPTGSLIWGELYRNDNSHFGQQRIPCDISHNGKNIFAAETIDYADPNVPLHAFQTTFNGPTSAIICMRDSALYDTISGHVFADLNANGVKDGTDTFITGRQVYIYANSQYFSALTDNAGYYSLILPKWGLYGSCYTPLYIDYNSYQEAFTLPANTYYYYYSPSRSTYDFGLAPATVVKGSIYYDDDRNGSRGSISAEPGIAFQSVTFNGLYQAFDNSSDGSYTAIIPYGNQNELFDKNDAYISSVSSPASYSFYGAVGATNSGKDFGAYFATRVINSAIDMWSNHGDAVSGRAFSQQVMINNVGSALASDTVVIHYDPALIYNGAGPGAWVADTVNRVLTLITDTIVPARFHSYSLDFTVRPTTPAGYVLRLSGTVNPNAQPDVDTTDNRTSVYYIVRASYDPNDKVASTNTDTPYLHKARLWSDGRDYIKYTIDFQNTGTYQAFDITLLDSLSPLLDWTSVRVLASSHACVSSRYGNVLTFKFNNINLPPSSVNDTTSRGYVVFEIKPSIYARPGDSIPNHAAIYFDYNTAVITNTNVVHLIGDSAPHRAIYTNIYAQVCSRQSYVYHGHTYSGPGLYYTDTLRSMMGVDSITVLHLDRNRTIYYSYATVYQCDFSNFVYQGDTIRAAGTYYSDTFQNMNGCDSIRVLNVYSGGVGTYGISKHLCRGQYYIFYGDTLRAPGYYTHHLTAVNGCDSIRAVYVDTTYRVYYSSRYIYVCDYSNIIFHGDTIRQAGTYFGDTVRTADGCDSVDILYVYDSYYPSYHYSSVNLCHNNFIVLGNDTIRQAGYYTDTLQGLYGCDSIVTLYVTTYNYRSNYIYYCTAGSYYYQGHYYTAYQQVHDTIPSVTGCDTIVTTYFYQNIGVSYEANDTLCYLPTAYSFHNRQINLRDLFFHNGFSQVYYSQLYYTTISDTIHLSSGCDSLSSRTVYVRISWQHNTYYTSSCGESGQVGQPLLSPGVYDSVYHLPDGCDYAVTNTVLAQGSNVYYYQNVKVCPGDSIQIRGRWYHGGTTTTYLDLVDTFTSRCGIDSMVHTHYNFITNQTLSRYYYRNCLNDTVMINNIVYDTDTNVSITYHTGCYDSTVIYNIYSPYTYLAPAGDFYDTICTNYSIYTSHGYMTFSTSQVYLDTVAIPQCADTLITRHFITVEDYCYLYGYFDSASAPGCDGSQGSARISAYGGAAPYTYRWSTGSTGSTIYPTQAGTFTVTITDAQGATASTSITLGGARSWSYYINSYFSQGCYRESKTVQLNMNGNYQYLTYPVTVFVDSSTQPQITYNYYSYVHVYGVSPGYHTFYVRDSIGCQDTLSVYVPGDAVDIHNVKPSSCFGNGGSKTLFTYDSYYRVNTDVTLVVDGLPSPLHYHQIHGTDTLYGLRPGYHRYTITNTTGCSYTDSFYVPNDSIHYVMGHLDVQPAGGCLPMATLYVQCTVGIPQYHYSWQQGQVSDTLITHLPATGYVLIHDSTAFCYDSLSYYQPAPAGDSTRITATSCIGSSYLFHGQVITATGVYTATLSNRSGCDSVVILSVPHMGHGDSIVVVDTFCSGGYLFHGHQYYASGTYMDTLINSYGCDSVTYLHLTKTNVDTVNITAPSCMGSSYLFNGQVIAATGLYTATFTNRLGCDSVVILSVPHLGHADSIVMVDTFCSGGYLFHGHQYYAPGTYIDTLINRYGCDSVTYLHLVRLNVDTTFISGSACSGTGYYFGGATLYEPGRYSEHTGLGHSCDSVTVLDLMIYTSYTDTVQAAICHGDSVYFANQWLHTAGTYTHSSGPIGGCDSTVTLKLSVSAPVTDATSATICQGASYPFAGNSYTTAGTYTGTFTASSGCDSIVTLTLSVSGPVTQNLKDTICDGEAYYLGGTPYYSAGTYTNTVSSAGRCDTLQTLHLIVLPSSTPTLHITVSPGPAVNGLQVDTFRANYTGCDGAYYSWYLNLQPVGQHDSLAIITHHIAQGDSIICRIDCGNRCASTTYTYSSIVMSGLTDHDPLISSMAVYPNPNHGSFILESSGLIGGRYTIYDMLGKEVMTHTIASGHEHIDMPGAASGVYNVQIQSGDDIHILRLIIEN